MINILKYRKSKLDDIENIMKIIKEAQNDLKIKKINQWQNGYPDIKTIKKDILMGNSYVLEDDMNIIGTMALIFGNEPTYEYIDEGKWLTEDKYAVIHRIAIKSTYKRNGIGKKIMGEAERLTLNKNINYIRIDTHRQNITMINFLKNLEFHYSGIIYLENKEERLAFEKKL